MTKKSQEVIELLEEVLEHARAGEVLGIALVTIEPDDIVGQGVAGDLKHNKFKSIAAVEVLKRDLMDGVERFQDRYPKQFSKAIGK